MKNVSLQTFFFRNANYLFLHISCLQTIYFVFVGIFHTPPPPSRNIMNRPLLVQKSVFQGKSTDRPSFFA